MRRMTRKLIYEGKKRYIDLAGIGPFWGIVVCFSSHFLFSYAVVTVLWSFFSLSLSIHFMIPSPSISSFTSLLLCFLS